MSTTKHDITIPQGSHWRLVVTVSGGPQDLSGYTGEMQIRQVKADPVVLASVAPERFTVNAGPRQVILELTDEDTLAYTWGGSAVYDLYVVGPTGDRWRVIEGRVTINKTVTRE